MTRAIVTVLALVSGITVAVDAARAEDDIDRLLASGKVPAAARKAYGYSDYTDPLGRFLDMLGAGAFDAARALQPRACERWRSEGTATGFSGRFWVWDMEMNLDRLCGQL